MKIYLAATHAKWYLEEELKDVNSILESFWYVKDWQLDMIKRVPNFLLDSGAFTFMNAKGGAGKINLQQYIDDYCDFVIKHEIEHFFELDIDVVVGYPKVIEINDYITKRVGRKPVPVWHKSRGLDEWIRITKEHDLVSIGGIVTKEFSKKEYPIFTQLLKIAHANGCKVHGLGFTALKELHKYPFDSVDSTSWTSGGRFGTMYNFKHDGMQTQSFKNRRVKDFKKLDAHNLKEWTKYQKWAELHLGGSI